MTNEEENLYIEYYRIYDELYRLVQELKPYYNIDKVKPYSVYVWTKDTETDWGTNVFDIEKNEIVFYDKNHKIIEEAKPIIEKIQFKLRELDG